MHDSNSILFSVSLGERSSEGGRREGERTMTRGRAMETGDDGRREMETIERAASEAPAFAGEARERERERKKLALSLHRVYMLAHTASNRVRALHSFLVHANLITHIPPTQKTDSLRTLDKKRRILDDADLVGDFNGVAVLGESAVRLLVTVRANEGVDLHALNVVHALDRFLDLLLVRASVDDEDERVVGLNLRQRVFIRERVLQDL